MATMYLSDVTLFKDSEKKLKLEATVVRDGGSRLRGATVSFALTKPDGSSETFSAVTNTSGVALVEWEPGGALPTGSYTLTVTNVTHPTHTYDPARNVESSATVTV